MPISPENAARYPKDWRAISRRIKERAGWRCESVPGKPACGATHGERHPITKAIVVLTVARRQKYHTRVVRAVIADLRPFVAREHIKAVALIIAKHRAESYQRGHAVAYHQRRRAS